jgi:hypothetical protein
MRTRKETQAEILILLGELISPLEDLVRYPDQQTSQSRAKASAKFAHDRQSFLNRLNDFAKGEPGHDYHVENSVITGRMNRFLNQLEGFRDDTDALKEELSDLKKVVTSRLLAIPCEIEGDVVNANSPFSCFIKIRSIIETAQSEVVIIDPYMSGSVIRRYMSAVDSNARVTVVTKRRAGGMEFGEFIDISKLYASERGPQKYRLMYHSDLHDRYLQCDNAVYTFGGSFKDAANKSRFTITTVKSKTDGKDEIKNIIQQSIEQYGQSNNQHPNA